MASQNNTQLSSSPSRSLQLETQAGGVRAYRTASLEDDHPSSTHPRRSPTISRPYDPNHPDVQERQRTMDVDSAMSMQLSRARSSSVAIPTRPSYTGQIMSDISPVLSPRRSPADEYSMLPTHEEDHPHHPMLSSNMDGPHSPSLHLNQAHDPNLLVSLSGLSGLGQHDHEDNGIGGLPMYQANMEHRSHFDFSLMESFAAEEKAKLGLTTPQSSPPLFTSPRPSQLPERTVSITENRPPRDPDISTGTDGTIPDSASARMRQRKLSLNLSARPRRQGGKMALFEGQSGAPPPSLGRPTATLSALPSFEQGTEGAGPSRLPPPMYGHPSHDRPYRFSFYSNALSATIHARSLTELPAEGQSFEDLFAGVGGQADREESRPSSQMPLSGSDNRAGGTNGRQQDQRMGPSKPGVNDAHDGEPCTWWLDITSPTDEEMKLLSKVFSLHPLTTEDIQMEEAREKIELFRNYYLVCFRSFDQDPYSPTYLEPLNMYIVVFREGTLSFHFRPTTHSQNVRRRIKQLKDYINVTSDWISYALIDDITDAFGPLIQSIEYEVDSIDELVLILKEAEQSDMLRRIGTCRKKVMGLLRLMGNKADVVKGLAKRCNENWTVAPKSDIGLYLSDIQDHLITMTQNLNHYEKILSRSHSNYLAQISIEMTDANNQINDVLSKLTAMGTVLIPMNLVTGLWGMNVHVPGQDDTTSFTWFVSIIGGLLAFAVFGGYFTYRLMVRSNRR